MAVITCAPGEDDQGRSSGGGDVDERRPPGRRSAAATPPPPALLEYFQNVVMREKEEGRIFELSKCGCDCWYCPDCCERKGYNLRAELIPILETFRGLMMLTLTIDPELFESPREAYLYVRERRAISILMRDLDAAGHLHSRRYFYVVEFQKHTEQVHFHVLIDASRVPKSAIDASWSKHRPSMVGPPEPNRPAFGMTRFSVPRFDGGPAHAGRYATKYLTKTPAQGWPDWVLNMGKDHRLPRYGTSRGFWGREPRPSNPTGKTRETNPRTYAARVADCGTVSNLFERIEEVDTQTGEVTGNLRWLARLGLDADLVRQIAPDIMSGKCRVTLKARDVSSLMDLLKLAAGQPVAVMSQLNAGGKRP